MQLLGRQGLTGAKKKEKKKKEKCPCNCLGDKDLRGYKCLVWGGRKAAERGGRGEVICWPEEVGREALT